MSNGANGETAAVNLPTVLEANQAYAAEAARPRHSPRPARKLCILTCMDARLDLFRALGLAVGDAHILRNAGGRTTDDAIRSLVLSSHHLGTREFAVIHHTNCGLYDTTNEAIAAGVAAGGGSDAGGIDFLPFDDVEASIREDVEAVRTGSMRPADATVRGALFDVDNGTVTVVVPPQPIAR